jgi:hypothetical protein
MTYNGYARYVVVEAIDAGGNSLGKSKMSTTLLWDEIAPEALAEELLWLHGVSSDQTTSIIEGTGIFVGGIICGMVVLATALFFTSRGFRGLRSGPAYERVAVSDAADFDETRLDDLTAS